MKNNEASSKPMQVQNLRVERKERKMIKRCKQRSKSAFERAARAVERDPLCELSFSSLPFHVRVVLRWFPLPAERRSPSEYERTTAEHECSVEASLDSLLIKNQMRMTYYRLNT